MIPTAAQTSTSLGLVAALADERPVYGQGGARQRKLAVPWVGLRSAPSGRSWASNRGVDVKTRTDQGRGDPGRCV